MRAAQIGRVLGWLIAVGIIVIGARFLIDPLGSATGYGVRLPNEAPPAFLYAKGIRDIASGLIAVVLLLTARPRVLGLVPAAATTIPVADALIVRGAGGPLWVVLGIHAATAVLMLVAVACLLAGRPVSRPVVE